MCRNERIIWLVCLELLKCVARLSSSGYCAGRIASEPLREGKPHLFTALDTLRTKMELSLSELEQSNDLSVISFESQLTDLD
jgi:hypothetical protein